MPLDFRRDRTATGWPMLVVTGDCDWQDFPHRAHAVIQHFGMSVIEKIDGLNERMWITQIGGSLFCVSWDIWIPEVSIMAWKDTPAAEIERLATVA